MGEMGTRWLGWLVRARFRCTSRQAADEQIEGERDLTSAVVDRLGLERAAMPCRVSKMLGVDEEMRGWSVLQILEHDTIVNRGLTRAIDIVGAGGSFEPAPDYRREVLPGSAPVTGVIQDFRESVDAYLAVAQKHPNLRGVGTYRHPVFGAFDAHETHCMFGFHLKIHRRQAEAVERTILRGPEGSAEPE